MSRTLRNALFALAAAIVVLAAAGFSYVAIMRHLTQEAESRNVLAGIGGPFTLTDQTGHKVSSSAYRGKLMLITFGYTYCPDVCPTTLTTMTDALDDLGAQADEVQPIFVTIDPERDTAKVLADYMKNFYPGFVGLTGSPQEITAVAKSYRVYYAKATPNDATDYLMDHSSLIYLTDRQGRTLTTMAHSTTPKQMAEKIRGYL